MTILKEWVNGDCTVKLYDNGTREIEGSYLDYPLNLDIRVSTECSFGQRKDGSFVLCDFCHESAQVEGKHADFFELKKVLNNLPPMELAIGCNQFTKDLIKFFYWCQGKFIVNITVNSGHLNRDKEIINNLIEEKIIYGLGISYRKSFKIPSQFLSYQNSVVHVICGIDDFEDIKNQNFKKILVLGCKDFGFNFGKVQREKVDLWKRRIHELFDKQVSFDNLAVDQLDLKRFFNDDNWSLLYQGEETFYINAVEKSFSPSSRSKSKEPYQEVKGYYEKIKKGMF